MADDKTKKNIESLVESALTVTRGENKNKTFIGLIVGFVVVCSAIAALYFVSWKKGREIAQAEHEHDVAAQKAITDKVDAEMKASQAEKEEALAQAAKSQQSMEQISNDLIKLEAEHAEVTKQINELNSWDAVDAFLTRK